MARRRYVSIKEVAARAGVSFQTASKVLNGGDVRVSVETEERILAAAAELGYRPNTIARSLVQRATATIGLVASDATDVAIAQASVAAEQAARKNGHSVLVGHLAAGGADGADIVRTLIERRVDGIIAAARCPTSTECPFLRATCSAATEAWAMATSVASLATRPMVAVARWTRLRAIVFGR